MYCLICNSRYVTLHRAFGSWPTGEFRKMSKQAQSQFWRDIKGMSGTQQMKSHAMKYMKSYEEKRDTDGVLGEFRPLGYWAGLGYDAERIERMAGPGDIQENRLAGTTYRVPVYSDKKERIAGDVREDSVQAFGEKGKLQEQQLAALADGAEWPSSSSAGRENDAPKQDEETSDSDPLESSDDDSSSSSSEEKHAKKAKKKKKSKKKEAKKKAAAAKKAAQTAKEQEKIAKEQEKEEKKKEAAAKRQDAERGKKEYQESQRRIGAAKKEAMRTLTKSKKIWDAMQLAKNTGFFVGLPPNCMQPFLQNFEEIKLMRQQAQACIDTKQESFGRCEKDDISLCQRGARYENMATSLMKVMAGAVESV